MRWTGITKRYSFVISKCDRVYYKLQYVLQSAVDLLQIATRGITKCDDYYKLRYVLQSAMDLLQIATGITKCDDYYKLRYVLQSAVDLLQIVTGITKCDYYKLRQCTRDLICILHKF